ncbi:hypothetical protein DFP72DRAFT_999160 [Ephemerocybe angulata]|uniref:CxC5 like cysteine cluster associated with KDZ domain-containing protein n=1 Tax=Ephemerocybe angulata TaxID=980116 RepID=A0A8H6IHU9_9AGAR|nr:hypothetical protein DFP72DRAFT_999160 [Tulosesus angulatus]
MDAFSAALSSISTTDTLERLLRFVSCVVHIKNEILLVQDSKHPVGEAPIHLSPSILSFLSAVCDMTLDEVEKSWNEVGPVLWGLEVMDDRRVKELFLKHGPPHGFSYHKALWPPSQYCTNRACIRTRNGRKMQVAEQRQGVLYTQSHGPVPVYVVHLKCKECATTYHVDYAQQNQLRTYYDTPSDVLQVADHHFAEQTLITSWKINMNLAHMSSSNCAATYLETWDTECKKNFPPEWGFEVSLNGTKVFDAFTLVTLLEDCALRKTSLVVRHDGLQAMRFHDAIVQRNAFMEKFGQPQICHSCSKCLRIIPATEDSPAKQVFVVVMDGITLGRPTCGEPHCTNSLKNAKQRYCKDHQINLTKCAITICKKRIETNHKTCEDPIHRAVEVAHLEGVLANFQLKGKVERRKVAHPSIEVHSGQGAEDDDEHGDDVELDVEETYEIGPDGTVQPALPDLPTQAQEALSTVGQEVESVVRLTVPGTKKLSARFGRTRTHNEQILVCPCGIIHARQTFLYAESMPACAKFIEDTYKHHPMRPNHIVFDNNCSLSKHVKNKPFFKDIGLKVDAFHFGTKHSKSDDYCQEHCNPAHSPELLGEDGKKWFFNTSIAEQTNVWLGGFHAICREMTEVRYDFFLDEMIKMRNERVLRKLKQCNTTIVYT